MKQNNFRYTGMDMNLITVSMQTIIEINVMDPPLTNKKIEKISQSHLTVL